MENSILDVACFADLPGYWNIDLRATVSGENIPFATLDHHGPLAARRTIASFFYLAKSNSHTISFNQAVQGNIYCVRVSGATGLGEFLNYSYDNHNSFLVFS